MEEKNKRVGVWIRTSTDLDSQKDSPTHHLERAKAYCSFKEWKIIKVYDLTATSGKSVLELPQTKEMISDIQLGKITGLIFSKLARLARSTRELLDLADIFRENNADLISLGESIDTSTPAGNLFFTVLAALAQFEREEISARVQASVPIRARLGKNTGGAAPFGYQWKNQQLIVNRKEAPIVKRMFEIFSDNKRKKTTARILNEEGYRTRNGSEFRDTTIDRLLTNPTMKGLHRANYTRSRGEGKAWDLKPASEWVFTEVEPIIDEKLFDEINSFLEQQRKSRKKVARQPIKHLFTGLTICGNCGTNMYIPTKSNSYSCRKCRKRKIQKDDLEYIYREQLKEFLISKEEIEKFVLEGNRNLQNKIDELKVLESDKTKVEKEINKVYDLYLSDSISKVGFEKKYKPLEERQNQLENQIPTIQGTIDALKQSTLSTQKIAEETGWLYNRWDKLNKDEQVKIIETITDKIIIYDREIEIQLQYLHFATPNLSQNTTKWQHKNMGSLLQLA